MKILVLGAAGGIGQHVVRRALEQGHEVTALVRNPQKLRVSHDNLRLVQGDVLNSQDVERALAGAAAVISALGVPPRQPSGHLIQRSMEILVHHMEKQGVRRLIFTSGIVVKTRQLAFFPRILMRCIIPFTMSDQVEDKRVGEALLKSSSLEWTLVYPTILTDGPPTGRYRSGEDIKLVGLPRIARADVADFILKLLSQRDSVHQELFVTR